MIGPHFSEPASLALQAAVCLGCGSLIGALYFRALHWSVRLFVAGNAPLVATMLQLGRLAFIAGALAVIVGCFGAVPLLAATFGILIARTAALDMGEQA